MRKDIQSMSDHELLMELVAEKRKLERLRHIKEICLAVLLVIAVILGCVYIPKILAPFRQFQEMSGQLQAALNRFNASMDSYEQLSDQARGLFDQLGSLDLSKLQETMDQLRSLNLPELQETADKLSQLVSRVGGLFGLG